MSLASRAGDEGGDGAAKRSRGEPLTDLVSLSEGTPIPPQVARLSKPPERVREYPAGQLLGSHAPRGRNALATIQEHVHQRDTSVGCRGFAWIDFLAFGLGADIAAR